MAEVDIRYAACDDGSVAWTSVGSGPFDLLFVPGFISHLELWWQFPVTARFLQRLASFSRLIMFDKRGTGLSDPVAARRPIEERLDELLAVLDAAGSERAAIMALSEGGMLAMPFAATHVDRVRSLVLVNTSPCFRRRDDWPHGWDDARIDEIRRLDAWGDGRRLASLWAPSLSGDERAERLLARFSRMSSSPAVARGIVETMFEGDVRAVLPTIQAPTLVVHADDDHTVPFAAGAALADMIPGARFAPVPSRDHLPWLEGADAVLDETEQFLTGARATPMTDRVLATVLFADIVDSTSRAAQLGDRRWRELVSSFEEEADRVVETWRGRRVKFLGDGLLASFDGPGRAVSAARDLHEIGRELGVRLRCGVHTGEVERVGDDLAGLAVHIGARVGSLAGPGEVLATATVRDLTAGSGIDWTDRGVHDLRGVPGEWRLCAAGP